MAARPDMRVHVRVSDLLRALRSAGVDSAAALAERWQADPSFLRPELRAWLRRGSERALDLQWPRLVAEVAARAGRGGAS